MDIIGYGTLKDEDIIILEELISFKLPDDYKLFLLEHNGGVPIVEYSTFTLDGIEEEIGLQSLYGLNLGRSLNLIGWYKEYKNDLLDNSIIIGHGLGVGLIVLVCSSDLTGVYLWDNTMEFEATTEENNIYKIAETFSMFIENLKP